MLLTVALSISNHLERAISRLYLLTEAGVYLELENGLPIETEL
jgi:hypothetical protein